jgi:hypothetical protein
VARLGARADEIVVADVERAGQCAEGLRVTLDQGADRDALALGGEDVGEAVLVGSGEKPGVVAEQPVIAGQHVGLDQLQGEAQMRRGVDVGYRGGDVERAHRASSRGGHPWPHTGESTTATGSRKPTRGRSARSAHYDPGGRTHAHVECRGVPAALHALMVVAESLDWQAGSPAGVVRRQ